MKKTKKNEKLAKLPLVYRLSWRPIRRLFFLEEALLLEFVLLTCGCWCFVMSIDDKSAVTVAEVVVVFIIVVVGLTAEQATEDDVKILLEVLLLKFMAVAADGTCLLEAFWLRICALKSAIAATGAIIADGFSGDCDADELAAVAIGADGTWWCAGDADLGDCAHLYLYTRSLYALIASISLGLIFGCTAVSVVGNLVGTQN